MKNEAPSPDYIASDEWFVDGDDHAWAVSGFDPKKGTVTLRLVDRPTREMTIADLRANY